MYAHSIGGAALANAMLIEERIVGGINMAGFLFLPLLMSRVHLSLSSSSTTEPTRTLQIDHGIDIASSFFSGWHAELSLTGSEHDTYSNLPYLVQNSQSYPHR